jgi:hypothetical protein
MKIFHTDYEKIHTNFSKNKIIKVISLKIKLKITLKSIYWMKPTSKKLYK